MVKNMEEKEIKNKKISSSQDNKSLKKNNIVDINDENTDNKVDKNIDVKDQKRKFTKKEKKSLKKEDKKTKTNGKKDKKKLTQADIKKYSSTQIDHVILKIKANERKYTIISVCIILFAFLVCSYIIFSAIQESNVKPTFKVGKLYYEFNETKNGLGDVISLVDVSPISDKDGMKTKTYTIKLYNSGKEKQKFKIFISDDKEMIAFDECGDKVVERDFIKYSINDKKALALDNDEEVSIISSTLAPKESRIYTIRCWVSDTYTKSDVVHYHGTISVRLDNSENKAK